jgi:predicted SprT family Zn-dependent metalloprotease
MTIKKFEIYSKRWESRDILRGGMDTSQYKGYVRFNMDLEKKPKDLLEYVVVHELCHLLEPKHSERFYDLLSQH